MRTFTSSEPARRPFGAAPEGVAPASAHARYAGAARRPVPLALGLILALLILVRCSPDPRPAAPPVVLISIDTCRADHLGCYGETRPLTPHLDAFAGEAYRFTRTISPVPMTLPAHCSMLTGLTPLDHGVHDNLSYRLGPEVTTLAEVFAERGYATAAFLAAFVLDSRFGLDQGFGRYDDELPPSPDGGVTTLNERRGGEVTARASAWIDAAPDDRFFLFVHYFDPHTPYDPPPPFATRFAPDAYAGEIAYTDACVGDLFARLRARGLYERSWIVVTGDHAEALGEHGESAHGYFIYQSTLSVPLLIKPPGGVAPEARSENAGLVDIVPTILGRLGIVAPAACAGIDLLAPRSATPPAGAGAPRALYCESLTPTKHGCAPLLGLLAGDFKYIQTTRPELYDLASDPAETRDLAGERASQTHELQARLEERLAASVAAGRSRGESEGVPGSENAGGDASGSESARGGASGGGAAVSHRQLPDPELRNRLESLGYLAGQAVSEGLQFDRGRPDPKDWIGFHEDFQGVLDRIRERRFAAAESLCTAMLAAHSGAPAAHILLGDIAFETRRFEQAVTHYRDYLARVAAPATGDATGRNGASDAAGGPLRLSPDYVRAHYDLANALAALGRREDAVRHYREAVRIQPQHLEAHYNLGLTLAELGRLPEAIDAFEAVLAIEPDFTRARLDLAQALLLRGRPRSAQAQLELAAQRAPGSTDVQLRLGDLRLESGDPNRAVAHYRAAAQMATDPLAAGLGEARALLALGQPHAARARYEQLAHETANWPAAANALAWLLATHSDAAVRDAGAAVTWAERAVAATERSQPLYLETLAAAYAEGGDFARAEATEREALALAENAGDARLAAQSRERLRRFQQRLPLRSGN